MFFLLYFTSVSAFFLSFKVYFGLNYYFKCRTNNAQTFYIAIVPAIKLYIRSKKEQSTIYVNFTVSRDLVFRKKTRFIVNAKDWNAKKQLPNTNTVQNKNLGFELIKFKNRIIESYNQEVSKGNQIDVNWFDSMLGNSNTCVTVVDTVQMILDNSDSLRNQKGSEGLSEGRKRIYKVFKNKIEEYNKSLKVESVSLNEMNKFKKWLKAKKYSTNYINSFISRLKTVCRYANKNGIELHPTFDHMKTYDTKKKVEDIIILTHEELDIIKKVKLPRELDIVRNWLLLGCELGQRGGDLLKIDSYTKIKNVKVIELTQEKTGKQVVIPINSRAWDIIKKGFPEPVKLNIFNKLVKSVCYRAGIKEMVNGKVSNGNGEGCTFKKIPKYKAIASHTMRRSFASNYYGKIPTPILIGITAHSSERLFMSYIGKTSLDNALEASKWFDSLSGS